MGTLSLCTSDHPYYKNTRMNVLQEQVFNLGICPNCHRKTVRPEYAGGTVQVWACKCGTILCTDREP